MLAMILSSLFALAAVAAITTIAASWQQHGAALLAARGQLEACPASLTVRYSVTELKVLRGSAKILVLPVRQLAVRAPRAALRAAA